MRFVRLAVAISATLFCWFAFPYDTQGQVTTEQDSDVGYQSLLIDDVPFMIPEGCSLQRVSTPALSTWPIVATWDEQGRLLVAESAWNKESVQQQLESRPHRLIRLSDHDGDGVFDRRQVVAEGLSFPEGVLCLGKDILVSAPPQIWRLHDADGDGVCETRDVWFDGTTLTHCANDLHGPWLGPDGWVYWSKSAFAEQTHEILTQGKKTSSASHLYRRHPSGGPIEPVMTGGMDNLVDVAWHPNGERFFCATFLHHPRDRFRDGIGHAMYGAVFGKPHAVLDGHPKTGPLMEPLVELGPAAPAGLLYLKTVRESIARQAPVPEGMAESGFLAAAQFNLHKISVHPLFTSPDRAGYASASVDLVSSSRIDFHPVDVLLDRDGSLIILDTGGWYDLCCPSSGTDQRVALGGIYRLRGATSDRRVDAVRWPAVEQGPSIESLAQALVEDPKRVEVWKSIDALLESESVDVRLAAMQLISLYRHQGSRNAVRACLYWNRRKGEHDLRTVRLAIECLGRLGFEGSVHEDHGDILDVSGANSLSPEDRSLQHALIYAMIEGGDVELLRIVLDSQDSAIAIASALALQQRGTLQKEDAPKLCQLASATDARIRQSALEILQHHPEWSEDVFVWIHERFRTASDEDLLSLATILSQWNEQASVQQFVQEWLMKAPGLEAGQQACLIQTLVRSSGRPLPGSWAKPVAAWIDAVDSQHPLAGVLPQWSWAEHGGTVGDAVQRQVLRGGDDRPTSWLIWSRSLPAGATLPAARETSLIEASVDGTEEERALALETLQRVRLGDPALATVLISRLGRFGPLELPMALEGLLRMENPEVDRALLRQLAEVDGAKALNIDRVLAMLRARDPAVVASWRETLGRLQQPPAELAAVVDRWMKELPSGDPTQGYHVFRSAKAACSACHRIGYVGGNIGPVLSQIGRSRSRRDLIEAIVFPSARLEQSYRSTNVRTTEGDVFNGLVVDENDASLTLLIAADRRVTVSKSDIDALEASTQSIMPAGLDQQLSQQELADLIAFLENAK